MDPVVALNIIATVTQPNLYIVTFNTFSRSVPDKNSHTHTLTHSRWKSSSQQNNWRLCQKILVKSKYFSGFLTEAHK